MNDHEVIDERNLEMHGVVARELRSDPAKLRLVVAWIEKFLADPDYSIHSKDALTEWLDLIRLRGLPGVLAALEDRSEEGQRMRQSSPFAVVMPQDERRRILARYETHRSGTYTATLPVGWESRLVKVCNKNTDDSIGWCLDPHDIAFSKLVAQREKDLS